MFVDSQTRLIAFYLPQFHPIPENDAWWGEGFTEWRTVVKAKPLFKGHYQPHLPADLGFYDLRLPEIREAQAAMAREYGVFAFCYYHYWFNGRRLLERPFSEVLSSGRPDYPFCLCWANENWTRVWDGGSNQILISQNYSVEDDRTHMESLIPAFRDPRYVRIDGKPVFLVYRTELLPDPLRTTEIWRQVAAAAGPEGLYLIRVESFCRDVDPQTFGFDAAVEFSPDWRCLRPIKNCTKWKCLLAKCGVFPGAYFDNAIVEYQSMVNGMLNKKMPDYKRYSCVTPMWDNSARRVKDAAILVNSTPEKYEAWLREAVDWTRKSYEGEERIVFVNGWNEWGEGNHLEPDLRWGRGYLEATLRVMNESAQ